MNLMALLSRLLRRRVFLAGVALGMVVAVATVGLLRERERQIALAESDQTELIKACAHLRGQRAFVVAMMRGFFEKIMCRSAEMQQLYDDASYRRLLCREVAQFYSALGEKPPRHVAAWLKDGSLVYDSIEDALSESIFETGMDPAKTYYNISNLSWTDVEAEAVLEVPGTGRIERQTVKWGRIVKPGAQVKFQFHFENPDGLEWGDYDMQVHVRGHPVE